MAGDDAHHRGARERDALGRRWLDLTDDRNVLIAPLLSVAAFVLLAVGDQSVLMRLLALLVQIALFQIVVTAHIRDPRRRRLMLILAPIVVIALISGLTAVAYAVDADGGRAMTGFLSAALAIGVMVRLFGRVARAPVINLRVVGDAIAVYLMMGLTFSYLYLALDALDQRTFFVQGEQPTFTFLYFSYITLATVGYGDFTAADTAGRLLALVEGLVGQLYLVTVLALIVSNLGRQRRPESERAAIRGAAPADPPSGS